MSKAFLLVLLALALFAGVAGAATIENDVGIGLDPAGVTEFSGYYEVPSDSALYVLFPYSDITFAYYSCGSSSSPVVSYLQIDGGWGSPVVNGSSYSFSSPYNLMRISAPGGSHVDVCKNSTFVSNGDLVSLNYSTYGIADVPVVTKYYPHQTEVSFGGQVLSTSSNGSGYYFTRVTMPGAVGVSEFGVENGGAQNYSYFVRLVNVSDNASTIENKAGIGVSVSGVTEFSPYAYGLLSDWGYYEVPSDGFLYVLFPYANVTYTYRSCGSDSDALVSFLGVNDTWNASTGVADGVEYNFTSPFNLMRMNAPVATHIDVCKNSPFVSNGDLIYLNYSEDYADVPLVTKYHPHQTKTFFTEDQALGNSSNASGYYFTRIPLGPMKGAYELKVSNRQNSSDVEQNYSYYVTINQGELYCPDYYTDVWLCWPSLANCSMKVLHEDCDPLTEYCDTENPACRPVGVDYSLTIEDAEPGKKVFKRPGDYVTMVYATNRTQTVNYTADGIYPVSGPCQYGHVNLTVGETRCKFMIPANLAGEQIFRSGERGARIQILTEPMQPDTIYVTDRGALLDRYPGKENETLLLLRELYSKAGKRRAIVYYLDDYLTSKPWNNFGEYSEEPLNPSMSKNNYVANFSYFTKTRCKDCLNIVIIGDDYVVPHYRVSYTHFEGLSLFSNWLSKNTQIKSILSDNAYIPTEAYNLAGAGNFFMNDFDPERDYVVIVKPDDFEYDDLIDNLTATLEGGLYQIPSNRIPIKSSSEVADNSYDALGEKTLILIGDRSDNNAISCLPWFENPNQEITWDGAVYLERNVWGGDNYAFVLAGPKVNRTIKSFVDFLNYPTHYDGLLEGKEAVYIHEFSMPPELVSGPDYVEGFVLGKCEYVENGQGGSCMVADAVFSVLPVTGVVTDARDAVLYCFKGGASAATDKLVCWSSSSGTVSSLGVTSVLGIGVAGPADVFLAGVKRVAKISRLVLNKGGDRLLEIINKNDNALGDLDGFKKFFGDGDLETITRNFEKMMNTYQGGVRAFVSTFDDNALTAAIKKSEDIEHASRGADAFLKKQKADLRSIINSMMPDLDDISRLDILKGIGRLGKDCGDDVSKDLVKNSDTLTKVDIVATDISVEVTRFSEIINVKYIDEVFEGVQSGEKGEKAMRWLAHEKGYTRLDNVLPHKNINDPGFDGIYRKPDGKIVIPEAKETELTGNLPNLLGTEASYGVEHSETWIRHHIDQIKVLADELEDIPENAAKKQQYMELYNELDSKYWSGNIERHLYILRKNGPSGGTIQQNFADQIDLIYGLDDIVIINSK